MAAGTRSYNLQLPPLDLLGFPTGGSIMPMPRAADNMVRNVQMIVRSTHRSERTAKRKTLEQLRSVCSVGKMAVHQMGDIVSMAAEPKYRHLFVRRAEATFSIDLSE